MKNLAIVLLAAGDSKRMEQPKQLLPFQGKKLIQIVVERLLACRCWPTVVVLGAAASEIVPYLDGYEIHALQNLNWQEGMASSIRCGVSFVESRFSETSHILFALGDQPYLEAEHYYAIVEAAEKFPEKVIAAFYAGQVGAPIVFPKKYFSALLRLAGNQGARAIVRALDQEDIFHLEMPNAALDWDYPSDLTQKVD